MDARLDRYEDNAFLSQLSYLDVLTQNFSALPEADFIEQLRADSPIDGQPVFADAFASHIAVRYELIRGFNSIDGFQAVLLRDRETGQHTPLVRYV